MSASTARHSPVYRHASEQPVTSVAALTMLPNDTGLSTKAVRLRLRLFSQLFKMAFD